MLRDLSLEVPRGDFLSILGPNGSGKSTLLRLFGRILIPSAGFITLSGKRLESYSRKELARTIGYVPQETAWIYPFTVLETVLMGRAPHLSGLGFERPHDLAVAQQAMKLTDIIHLADKPVTALSGGERQRVLIARALAQEPQILLLDEPNAHLDLSHQVDLFRLLRGLNQKNGLTILSISHDLHLAANFSKRIMLLASDGGAGNTAVAIGKPDEVLTSSTLSKVFHTTVTVDRNLVSGYLHIYPETILFEQGESS
ncbi:MAG TPA: ABC transporter ATP-binding protein [Bacteroidota bacterium]|nr:ABC transporter ATP-binding protein [Bacteroidota bacterium]